MKYILNVHTFTFNKIKNGSKKIVINLLDKNAQRIDVGDTLDIHNTSNKEHTECIVKGIAIFDNFNDMADILGPEALGYSNKTEVLVRVNRMFPKELLKNLNAVAFFLEQQYEKERLVERGNFERDTYER